MRTLGTAAAITVLVGGVAACANSSKSGPAAAPGPTSNSPSAPTQTKSFAAYTATGSLAVAQVATTSGSCWTTSITVVNVAAYRCLAGNDILDPCFAPPHQTRPTTVACVPDPWTGARLVTLTKTLPARAQHATNDRFWALELANGAHCVEVTGTVATVGGVAMDYVCGSGLAAGAVHRVGDRLVASYGSLAGTALQQVAVTTAWTG